MISKELLQSVKSHEGRVVDEKGRHRLYTCPAGKPTIGYGHNLEEHGLPGWVAEELLKEDLNAVQVELTQVKLEVLMTMKQARNDVLTEMAFNMGVPRLLQFKKMWAALEAKDYETAADEMLDSRWAEQVGARAIRLAEAMRG